MLKKLFKRIFEITLVLFLGASIFSVAAPSYRAVADTPALLIKYVNGVITDLVDTRGNAVGLVTSTNNQTLSSVGLTGGAMLCNATAPTIASGFGASAVMASSNGSCTFQINVGATSVSSSGVLAMPAASNGWNCMVAPASSAASVASAVIAAVGVSTTQVNVTNYSTSTGAALNWANNAVLALNCFGY